jgi:hypothetical protein
MGMKKYLAMVCALVLVLASSGATAAIDLGPCDVDLSSDDVVATVPFVADFEWSVWVDGSQIVLSSLATIDDNNNAVNFSALIFFDAQLMDGETDDPKEHRHTNFTNPGFPRPINSGQWPVGQSEDKWLHVVFNSTEYEVGDYIHCTLAASGVNYNVTPPATDGDECWFRVTIID